MASRSAKHSMIAAAISLLSMGVAVSCFSVTTHSGRANPTFALGSRRSSSVRASSPVVLMAGFGGGGGGMAAPKKGKKNKKGGGSAPALPKLKPKLQWDRYCSMAKESAPMKVAVRVVRDEESGDWLEVGRIRSAKDEFTEVAVVRQRAMIAEHAKRLYPLQVLAKDRVEWAYFEGSGEDEGNWVPVDKSAANDAPDGIEKKVGFEGKPDPATGFYCHYSEGRLVASEAEGKRNQQMNTDRSLF